MPLYSQQVILNSPNQKISVALFNMQNNETGSWYLQVNYSENGKMSEVIPRIDLGISRADQDFSKELKFLKAGKPLFIDEQYTALHGKRSLCTNQANEIIINFENPSKAKLNLILRAYNDGVVFRYEFPEKEGSFVVKDEFTSYSIPGDTKRWLEKWNPANEGLYSAMNDMVQFGK